VLVATSFICILMSAHVLADNITVQSIISACLHNSVNPFVSRVSAQGPCHLELQIALDKIAKSQQKLGDKLTRFYLPNCDKHGLYKPKQVGIFCQIGSECEVDGFMTRLSMKESHQFSQDYVRRSPDMMVCVCVCELQAGICLTLSDFIQCCRTVHVGFTNALKMKAVP